MSRFPAALVTFFALWLSASVCAAAPQALQHDHVAPVPSKSLNVRSGDRALTLSVAELQSLPQVTVQVLNAHTKQNESYTGPLLSDVLAKVGVTLSEATQHGILDSYITATGTDGYFVVYSGAELQPGLHKAQVIVAVAQAGQPLGRTGAFQLVDTEDVKPARWVRNLSAITVVPVSMPAQ